MVYAPEKLSILLQIFQKSININGNRYNYEI
jgi:hypothetical protein